MTCDDFQIAFDQQQAGVSSAMSTAEVGAHVATCAACTAYVSVSEKLSHAMTTAISGSPAPLQLDAMLARVTDARRRLTRSLVAVPVVVGLVLLPYFVFVLGISVAGSVIGLGVATLVVYGLFAVIHRRRVATLVALDRQSGDGLVHGLRVELDRQIRNDRQAWWVLPLLLVLFHLTNFGLAAPPVAVLVLEFCYLAVPLPLIAVRYRRLVRERALLG
jgi:hypothetical protein